MRLLSNPPEGSLAGRNILERFDRAHERGIAVVGATLTPFEGAAYYSLEKEVVRQAVNNWIRSSDELMR
ncbi:hypothetical protein ACI48D_02190 [Massilia sp. LXY-6]|uniref:hypothetical protein n=1 Tax=Massilia sp. LXY-6 TaxID=3379823 RepID=UPI003EDF74D8